jgi:hypothetical protein
MMPKLPSNAEHHLRSEAPSTARCGWAVRLLLVVRPEVIARNLIGWDELIVPLFEDSHFLFGQAELEECDQIVGNELGRDGAAHELRELFRAARDVLFRLNARGRSSRRSEYRNPIRCTSERTAFSAPVSFVPTAAIILLLVSESTRSTGAFLRICSTRSRLQFVVCFCLHVNGCFALRSRLHYRSRRTTVDRMAAHRKSGRRRADLCAGGLRKRALGR